MNNKTLYGLISSSLLLTACGGGGSTNIAPSSTYQITGTVPGTLIEAYCDNGSTYSVKSTQNGTSKHPFSLKLPKNLACRVVMITNEDDAANKVITPIKFIDQQGKTSTIISSKTGGDIDLGNVNLALTRASMTADSNNDGVEDIPKEVILNDADASVIERTTVPLDTDKDGIPNIYEDDDGDGIPNRFDNDDDGDGIPDINDNDHNNDGVNDDDLDGDGIKNKDDVDDDNDGIADSKDNDDDNDGIVDSKDDDDDNDGIKDKDDDNNDDDGNGNGGGNDDNGNGGGNDDNGNGGGNDDNRNGGGNDDNGNDD